MDRYYSRKLDLTYCDHSSINDKGKVISCGRVAEISFFSVNGSKYFCKDHAKVFKASLKRENKELTELKDSECKVKPYTRLYASEGFNSPVDLHKNLSILSSYTMLSIKESLSLLDWLYSLDEVKTQTLECKDGVLRIEFNDNGKPVSFQIVGQREVYYL